MIEQHYTAEQVAKRLNVDPRTVQRELEGILFRGCRRYPESEVVAYLESQRAPENVVPLEHGKLASPSKRRRAG